MENACLRENHFIFHKHDQYLNSQGNSITMKMQSFIIKKV